MLIDLTFETVKFIVMQSKNDSSNVNFSKLEAGMYKSFSDNWWNHWLFDTYSEMVAWVTNNLPEQVENIPPEQML